VTRREARSRIRPLRTMVATIALSSLGYLSLASPSTATTPHTGTVKVLSAGSLTNIMTLLGPAFTKDTGYTLQNTSAGSSALATGIAARTLQGDVFISASTSADRALEGSSHGNWISSYTFFGTSPDVLSYYPKSRFASALRSRPWYDVVPSSGFELGRTNPAVDPSGVLDVDALKGIGYAYNIPSLLTLAATSRNVYTEEALPGLLQAGQLDGAFMYAVSAHAAGLPYVALVGTKNLDAQYTIAALHRGPDPAPASAFIAWFLSKRGLTVMERQGLVAEVPAHVVRAS
jgi:molybdate/tungstate transport system substrate-binding protein